MISFIIQISAAFIGTVAFAVLFETPTKLYLISGNIGAIGWGSYLIFMQLSGSVILGTFVSALILTCLSRWASFFKKVPTTIFLICGIFALVPGIGIYNTTYYFFMDNGARAGIEAAKVLKLSVAIAFGIFAALSLPAKLFHLQLPFVKKNKQKNLK